MLDNSGEDIGISVFSMISVFTRSDVNKIRFEDTKNNFTNLAEEIINC